MSDITPADALRELGDDQAEYAAAAAKKLGLPESGLYVAEPVDRCVGSRIPLGCGAPAKRHPMNMSGYYHEFEPGLMEYRPATPGEIIAGQALTPSALFVEWLAERDRASQAAALRAAAADDEHGWALRRWLNERADRIERGEVTP